MAEVGPLQGFPVIDQTEPNAKAAPLATEAISSPSPLEHLGKWSLLVIGFISGSRLFHKLAREIKQPNQI
ncbi:hypothetical protein ZHAS_00016446 [Anopheles sinensis]|uniref:Uncharacterized protein n=1 Tax=Anopheles sinensis TaxID=74873 RepID=A0A084WE18_ANOSI|nr:hypothetical protein ZHAS_00016446 [Anopheles sinensis]